ncbi:MAG: PorT family protein [Bacteroidetes bacterium]|nr:PorT family protein [Bacteroidota bacterium]
MGGDFELNLPDHDEKKFHFGINVGINRSHYHFSFNPRYISPLNDSISRVESINSTGINLAWLVNMRLGEHFDLRTFPLDLVFTEKAFEYRLAKPDPFQDEDSSTIKKIQGITLALPVQIKFSSDRIKNFKVYMMAGGKVEYDFAANAGKKNEKLIKLSKIDYGIEAGIGFHFYFDVFVLTPELKLGWGLKNVHVKDEAIKYSNIIDQVNSRTLTLSLTVE